MSKKSQGLDLFTFQNERNFSFSAAIVESIPEALISYDVTGTVMTWNPAATQLLGYTANEMLGRPIWSLIPGDRRAEEEKLIDRLSSGGSVETLDTIRLSKAGSRVSLSVKVGPVRERSGALIGICEMACTRQAPGKEEVELRDSERFNRTLVQSSRDCIKILSLEGRLLWMSEHGQHMLCIRDLESVLGKSWIEFWPEADQDAVRAIVGGAARGHEGSFQAMYRVNGEPRWFDVLVSPIFGDNGRPVKLLAVSRDVTARCRAEQAIDRLAADAEHQRRFYETILSNTPDLVYVFGLDHRFTYANQALLRMWGKTWREAIGKNCLELGYEPWHAAMHDREIERVIATRQPIRGEVPFSGTNGPRIYDYIFVPVLGPTGQVEAIAGTTRDVTERKHAEEALRESEAVLRTVANEARVGLVMVDNDRRYLFANQTYTDILGLPHTDIVGQRVPDVLAHIYDQVQPHLDRALKGERVNYELYLPQHSKTGEERVYEVVYEPRISPRSEPYVIVVLADITERKKIEHHLEELVAQRTAKLTETIGELEAFSYTIAHDMRAPLRAMQSFSGILAEEHADKLDARARDLLQRIVLSANRLDHLIRDILDYSRIVRADLDLAPVDTQSLAQEIIQSYPNLQPQNADIIIPAPLPPVMGNRAALTQVFANLLGNAVKFVAQGVRPQVYIRAEPGRPGFVRLLFDDNGIGIEQEYHKRLFQMFQRANKSGLYEGTGMGLAIVRKAIERMGGHVGVKSDSGKGSRFWIELPSPQISPDEEESMGYNPH